MSLSDPRAAFVRRSRLLAIVALALPAAALAQTTPAQTPPAPQPTPTRIIPPIDFSLPPGPGQQQPAPAPSPTPVPAPSATPTPAPRAAPAPSPTPTQAVRPAPAPVPRATAPAANEPAPAPSPAPTLAPVSPAPLPPVDLDAELPPAPPLPDAPTAAPLPTDLPPTSNVEAGDSVTRYWPWALAALALVALAVAAGLWWRRRRALHAAPGFSIEETLLADAPPRPTAAPQPSPPPLRPAPAPASPAPPTPVAPLAAAPAAPPRTPADPPRYIRATPPPAPPAGTITAFRDRPAAPAGTLTAFRDTPAPMLEITLAPRAVGTTEEAGVVDFAFVIRNPSAIAVTDTQVSAWLLTANEAQDAQIAGYLSEPADPGAHNRFTLRPGDTRELSAAMGLPFEMLNIVEHNDRRFFAPIVLIDARYVSQGGVEGRTSAAFMVGKPGASGKLAPVFVDRGARIVEGVEARPYPIRAMQPPAATRH
ncbi:hypothetical protein [Sphingomonas baiyangensis]|uniref:Uncharacterized protein n=1 Tax=Sphingomonas baiyangensis TaxID=2572576 RepID=A0A4U1L1C6_9SPHN|nr:hypothetical protein [Sphingomonas baiyangensis]TKD49903.1 hypothetical protein FBR43_03310 [Sphingomonas baiyangensis]